MPNPRFSIRGLVSSSLVPIALALVCLSTEARAQREHGGQPPSQQRRLKRAAPTVRMPPVQSALLLAEDAADRAAGKKPLRFAEVLPLELGLENAGRWEELGGGDRLWRLRLRSPGAKSLALIFSRLRLPAGAELYFYDDEHKVLRGAYTEHENQPDGTFAMRPLRGDAVTLEYYEPARGRGQGELELSTLAHDYLDVLALIDPEERSGGGGSSASCEVDVACPLGDPWPEQIDSAVHIQSLAGGLICSGSLLNNTANDGTLLVLSAAHCGSLTNAIYTFNYERDVCNTGTAPCNNTLLGATLLVRDQDLDVQLLRVDAPQGPQPFSVHLAGWDRSDVPPAFQVIVHHPVGDAKKISRDNDPPVIFENFWRIRDWDQGVTEGGSSGAPMFDPAGRFIGSLDSGSSTCMAPTNDDFATRLAAIWPLVEPYLDPLGTGRLFIDGLDLALVSPRPFAATALFPTVPEPLDPGAERTQRILGSGFQDTTVVALDGVPMDPTEYERGGHSFLNVNLPPLPVGPHLFEVTENGMTQALPFDVGFASQPRMQTANGVKGELVFSFNGVDTIHSDVPGHTHWCIWSLSNTPSLNPLISLGLGNNFTDLRACRITTIPMEGFVSVHHAMSFRALPIGTRVYNQSVCMDHGRPFAVSNMQETEFNL